MSLVHVLSDKLSPARRRLLRSFDTPFKIQAFLDAIPYCKKDIYRSPLSIVLGKSASCLDGALIAALLLRELGHRPTIVELVADQDDDHIIALYKQHDLWGALAKSEFAGLRSREPVYRTLRELVLSYFPFYFNKKAAFTLRAYTVPMRLDRFDFSGWVLCDKKVREISDALDRQRQIRLIPARDVRSLASVDRRTYESEIAGSSHERTYLHYRKHNRNKR